jgi:PKD repeat protein
LVVAGISISLNASAADPAGGSLAYNWSFGDDSPNGTGAAVNHAYSMPGTYTLTLTITSSSSGGTTVFTEQVVVKSPLLAMTLSKFSGAVVFSSQNKDSCQFSGIIPGLPKGFNPLNQQATVLIGDASTIFTLDKNGHGHNADGSFALTLKHQRDPATKQQIFPGGNVKVQGKLMHGTWSRDWGFVVNSATPAMLSVEIDLNGARYGVTAAIKCALNPKGVKFNNN